MVSTVLKARKYNITIAKCKDNHIHVAGMVFKQHFFNLVVFLIDDMVMIRYNVSQYFQWRWKFEKADIFLNSGSINLTFHDFSLFYLIKHSTEGFLLNFINIISNIPSKTIIDLIENEPQVVLFQCCVFEFWNNMCTD